MFVIVRSRSSALRAPARSSCLLLLVVHVRAPIATSGDQTLAMVSFTFATSCLSVKGLARKL